MTPREADVVGVAVVPCRAVTRFCLLMVVGWVSASCVNAVGSAELETLGPFLDDLMVEHGVPGVGFAVFDEHGLRYEHVSGVKSEATHEPIDSPPRSRPRRSASLSSPLWCCPCAREGVLDLDAPLRSLVPELPELAHDPRSAILTPRMLLMHRGGLPNWRSRMNFGARTFSALFAPEDALEFVVDPDTEYRYSGEGYVLLQRIVEEMADAGLDALARDRVFDPLGMSRSRFLFDEGARHNHAVGHDADGRPDKWEVNLPLASSTLHTTAADLARFGAHLASQLIARGPSLPIVTRAVTIEVDDDLERSWGLGLGIVTDGPRRYFYYGGNNVIFIADFICGVEERLGYVLLTQQRERTADGRGSGTAGLRARPAPVAASRARPRSPSWSSRTSRSD